MGSPIPGFIAEAVMQKLESITLPKFNHKLWVRYIEDVFTTIEKIDIITIHETVNNVFEGIQFTVEEEKDHLLPFLDVAVRRTRNGQLETYVYRKTNSHRSDSALH